MYINAVKDENGVLVTDCNSILARWGEYLSQPLNLRGVTHVRQIEINRAESLVPEPSAFDVELAIEKLKRHKSPGIDQIPAEFASSANWLASTLIVSLVSV
jgi:hypothetical protein